MANVAISDEKQNWRTLQINIIKMPCNVSFTRQKREEHYVLVAALSNVEVYILVRIIMRDNNTLMQGNQGPFKCPCTRMP